MNTFIMLAKFKACILIKTSAYLYVLNEEEFKEIMDTITNQEEVDFFMENLIKIGSEQIHEKFTKEHEKLTNRMKKLLEERIK